MGRVAVRARSSSTICPQCGVSELDACDYLNKPNHTQGAFLPFHRYFVTVHEHLLRAECNYTGPLP